MAGSGTAHLRSGSEALLRVENLVVEFPVAGGRKVHAVSDVSFDVYPGETLGIVGESGSGKSTTGRALLQLPRPTSGAVLFDGVDLTGLSGEALRQVRTKLQVIFQDPISSLYPRRTVAELVMEPLAIWGIGTRAEREEQARLLLAEVNLEYDAVGWRRPYEFSIGQCQRISIARALMLNPRVVVCDEPVSALDVSVQAQILNLLEEMKRRHGLTLVFISHDLAVVKHVSDRVMVMFLGKTCEVAAADVLYSAPAHPYTGALLRASAASHRALAGNGSRSGGGLVGGAGGGAGVVGGAPGVVGGAHGTAGGAPEVFSSAGPSEVERQTEMPSSITPPSGCRYRTRCPRAAAVCSSEEPTMRQIGPDHFVACHFPAH